MATPVVWLPLNGDLRNIGTGTVVRTNTPQDTYTTGKMGLAVYSNAQAHFSCAELNGATTFSITWWLKIDSTINIGNWADIWSVQSTIDGTNRVIRDEFTNVNGNHQTLLHKDPTVGGSNTNGYMGIGMGGNALPKDQWVHFCITKNHTIVKSYVNGVYQASLNASSIEKSPQILTGVFLIGDTGSKAALLNDLRIYDCELSPKEVKEISQGLVLHYPLNGIGGMGGENLVPKSNNLITLTKPTSSDWDQKYSEYLVKTKLVLNETYTLSFDAWCSNEAASATIYFDLIPDHYNGSWDWITRTVTPTKQRFTVSATLVNNTNTIEDVHIRFLHSKSSAVNNIYIQNIKFERGSIATPWSPAPSDIAISTTNIPDCSGFGHDGMINGTLLYQSNLESRYNTQARIQGYSTNITAKQALAFKEYTLSIWIKMNTIPNNEVTAIALYNGANEGRTIINKQNSKTVFDFWVGGGSNYSSMQINATTAIVANKWYHLVGTKDSNNILRFYVNGMAEGGTITAPHSGVASRPQVGPIALNSNYNCDIVVADARIYATALSAADIAELYHTPASIDNSYRTHTYEYIEQGLTKVTKNGIIYSDEINETGVNYNLVTDPNFYFSYIPGTGTNSCAGNYIIDYSSCTQGDRLFSECDIEWSDFDTSNTNGTFGIWFQGSTYNVANATWEWTDQSGALALYNGSNTFTSLVLSSKNGKAHLTREFTLGSNFPNTRSKQHFGIRSDYSNGVGRVTIRNLKVYPAKYHGTPVHFGEEYITADEIIEI